MAYSPDTRNTLVLNLTCYLVWRLCDGKTTPEQIAAVIAECRGPSVDDPLAQVHSALDVLLAAGMLVSCGSS